MKKADNPSGSFGGGATARTPKHIRIDPKECRFCPWLNAPPKAKARSLLATIGRAVGRTLWSATRRNFCGICGCVISGKALLGLPCPLEENELTKADEKNRRVKWDGIRVAAVEKSFAKVWRARFG